ncbi:MAG: hypothetical protein NTZ14_06995 [Hyphomicrobiales bacterium]|nr:hypothetical protein [Hyphomicrobiales bacterium]
MCFMRDVSSHQIPPIRTTSVGHADHDHHRELAHRERIKVQRDALGAIGPRLRDLFRAEPSGH